MMGLVVNGVGGCIYVVGIGCGVSFVLGGY